MVSTYSISNRGPRKREKQHASAPAPEAQSGAGKTSKHTSSESAVGCNGGNAGCRDSTRQEHLTPASAGSGREREEKKCPRGTKETSQGQGKRGL